MLWNFSNKKEADPTIVSASRVMGTLYACGKSLSSFFGYINLPSA